MENQANSGIQSPDSHQKAGTYRTLGVYLEYLRLTYRGDNHRLSIKRLAGLAQMGTSTYENIKRA